MAEYKLDIFQTLSAADTQQMTWLDKQPVEAQSGFVPVVFMRWMSSVNSNADNAEWQLCAVNDRMNKNFWLLSDYPDLVFKLGCSTGLGKKQKHDWIPLVSNRKTQNKALAFMGEVYPRASWNELTMLLKKHSLDDFKELLIDNGIQKDDEKDLITAFKKLKKE